MMYTRRGADRYNSWKPWDVVVVGLLLAFGVLVVVSVWGMP